MGRYEVSKGIPSLHIPISTCILPLITHKDIQRAVYRLNSVTGYRDKIWIVGEGRSGTSWLQEMMNFDGRSRLLFEPMHPRYNKSVPGDRLMYARPGEPNLSLESSLKQVFSGKFYNQRVSKINKQLLDTIIVKDIFSHMYVKWAKDKFPHLNIIVLIRNPLDIARSKLKQSHWYWMDKSGFFLRNEMLKQDFLEDKLDVVNSVDTPFGEIVLSWAIKHHVMFSQLEYDDVQFVSYSELVKDPVATVNTLTEKMELRRKIKLDQDNISLLRRPSKTTDTQEPLQDGSGHVDIGPKPPGDQELTEADAVLEAFGLNRLFDSEKNLRFEELRNVIDKNLQD